MKYLITAAFAATLIGGAAQAADPAAGQETFEKACRTCHMVVTDGGDTLVKGGKTGPNLYGVVGRVAASGEDFTRYGKSIEALGETGFTWTEAEIAAYLADPRDFLRAKLDDSKARSNMAYKLPSEEDRANVAAYLASVSPGS